MDSSKFQEKSENTPSVAIPKHGQLIFNGKYSDTKCNQRGNNKPNNRFNYTTDESMPSFNWQELGNRKPREVNEFASLLSCSFM
jgi:hypothetical protein